MLSFVAFSVKEKINKYGFQIRLRRLCLRSHRSFRKLYCGIKLDKKYKERPKISRSKIMMPETKAMFKKPRKIALKSINYQNRTSKRKEIKKEKILKNKKKVGYLITKLNTSSHI